MTDTINETWEQQTFREIAEAETRAEVRAEARAEARARRDALRVLLEDRFGTLPQVLNEQLEAVQDVNRLRAALLEALHVSSLSEFKL